MTADGFAVETCFDNPRNMLRYFDSLLFDSEGNPVYPDAHKEFTSEQPVHYFTVGADRWNHADTFPPAGIKTLPLLLSSDGALAPAAVVDSVAEADVAAAAAAAVAAAGAPSTGRGVDEVPFARLGTGSVTRWNSLVFAEKASVYKPTYPFAPVRQLEYTTAPLPAALEVTGYPVLDVHVSFSCPQAALYAYIEDVWPSGKATCVLLLLLLLLLLFCCCCSCVCPVGVREVPTVVTTPTNLIQTHRQPLLLSCWCTGMWARAS